MSLLAFSNQVLHQPLTSYKLASCQTFWFRFRIGNQSNTRIGFISIKSRRGGHLLASELHQRSSFSSKNHFPASEKQLYLLQLSLIHI